MAVARIPACKREGEQIQDASKSKMAEYSSLEYVKNPTSTYIYLLLPTSTRIYLENNTFVYTAVQLLLNQLPDVTHLYTY